MNDWINVNDRLPQEYRPGDDPVLIYGEHMGIQIDYVSYPKDGNVWNSTSKDLITHWMPLPKEPTKGNQNE